jgi:D-alanine-D-alanine ligase
MDKQRSKEVFETSGLPIAHSVIADRDQVQRAHVMAPPYVVKPNNEGSSVGIYIVNEDANSPPHLSDDMPDTVMVEAYLAGRELTTTVMGDRALGVTEIFTDGWYDYDAKYADGGSYHVVPADIPADITQACKDFALRAHQVLGCKGVSRTDFRWDDTRGRDGLFLLETNTQPGMTPTSLVPEQAQKMGIGFAELCNWMIKDASCDR